jgi:hypothetical protein
MSAGSSRVIPHFVTAGSPQGLQLVMLRTNVLTGRENRYFDITYDGRRWIAWYYREADQTIQGRLARDVSRGER